MTVKVGQIYFHNRIEKKLIITCVDAELNLCNWVTEEGKTCIDKCDWIKLNCDLLGEYQTWQKAVDSPEFNGEK
jgi:hypothetical protein